MSVSMIALRSIDIRNRAEEILVQEVVDERTENDMPENYVEAYPSETDIATPEQEATLQAQLDVKRGKTQNIEDETEVLPESEVVEPSVESAVEPRVKSAFCDYCSTRGVKHKKSCTRPQ